MFNVKISDKERLRRMRRRIRLCKSAKQKKEESARDWPEWKQRAAFRITFQEIAITRIDYEHII